MVDGLARNPETPGDLDNIGDESLGPADIDVPVVQVGNQAAQRPLADRRLLAAADRLMRRRRLREVGAVGVCAT